MKYRVCQITVAASGFDVAKFVLVVRIAFNRDVELFQFSDHHDLNFFCF